MQLGYVRVSTKEQNTERQLIKMRALGIEERYIFVDKASGKDFDRPKYQALRLMIREGDLLYLDALDRLGRDYDGIISEWKYITREVGADIVVLENETLFDSRKFKTMGDIGKLLEDQFLSMLSYVAEQERKKNKQRQAEGIAVAVAAGVKFGRPKQEITDDFRAVYDEWKSGNITATEAMKQLGMKPNTFYRRVKEYTPKIEAGGRIYLTNVPLTDKK
ncbi:recombinase family protein [Paenibacillus sp. DMB5]|uniref:recombinase family protein n=1 Tax=Paenibacillus sp. DMB5 TaxID=1780103 RepID=UPI00076CC002|nr:recombinase family protein [Paenibacillus sp. DMB5]KUP26188.1 recombinase [Paenibacillus sp. DMB5]KUP26200.1 recombinase [Paenibacillus sp. DMB5]